MGGLITWYCIIAVVAFLHASWRMHEPDDTFQMAITLVGMCIVAAALWPFLYGLKLALWLIGYREHAH